MKNLFSKNLKFRKFRKFRKRTLFFDHFFLSIFFSKFSIFQKNSNIFDFSKITKTLKFPIFKILGKIKLSHFCVFYHISCLKPLQVAAHTSLCTVRARQTSSRKPKFRTNIFHHTNIARDGIYLSFTTSGSE